MTGVHSAAATGFQRKARTYDHARPSYRAELAARIAELADRCAIVELGAGTGIFTRQLLSHGAAVIAIEPVAAMRRALLDLLPDVDARDGTAESIPVETASARVVVASQSFHWFDHRQALDEIARILEPGGHLVTVWNVRDESVAWVADYTAVIDQYANDTPRYRSMQWRQAIESDDRFSFVEEQSFENPHPTDADGVVSRALSTSFIGALDTQEQASVADQLRTIVASLGERFAYPYVSELQSWRRTVDQHPRA